MNIFVIRELLRELIRRIALIESHRNRCTEQKYIDSYDETLDLLYGAFNGLYALYFHERKKPEYKYNPTLYDIME